MTRFSIEDMVVGTVAIGIVYGILLGSLIKNNRTYHWAFAFKVFCFIAYGIFLSISPGGGDSFYYHDVGSDYHEMVRALIHSGDLDYINTDAFWSPLGQQTGRMFSFTGLLLYVTGGSYLGASAICCGLGFAGQVMIHR